MEAALKLLIVVATLGSSRAYNGTARRLEGDGSPAFLAIGSFDESHAARRALIRRTYAAGLAPMADYAFYVQNASAAELRDAGDVVAAPHADVSRCGFAAEGKACRSGEVFLAGLEDYLRRSTRPYVLAIDDDGFLCRAAFQRAAKMLVRRGKTEGFVGGTWQRKGKDLVRPDQNFVLLSRDVATKAAAALRKAFAALGASHKTGTRDAAKLLAAQRFAMDLRDAVLHPHHNSLALLYQRERPGGGSFRGKAEPLCARRAWVHLCCSSGGTAALWEDLQRGADAAQGSSYPLVRGFRKLTAKDAFLPRKVEHCGAKLATKSCIHCKASADPPEVARTCASETAPRLVFWHLEKAGGEYVISELRRALGGTDAFDVVDEHSVLTAARREHSFTVGVSREPCDYYVSARAWGKTGRADFGLPGPETADHGKGWFALAVGAKDPAEWRDVYGDGPGAFAAWLRRASPERDGPRCGLLSMRLYTAVVAPEAAASINPPGCENARPAIAAGVGCPCPLADCAGAANDAQHAACAAALETADPAALFDCRLRLETVDADLAACLRRFEARGGAVAHPKPAGGPPPSRERRHAGDRGSCGDAHDAETRALVAASDGAYARLFGYEGRCCGGGAAQPVAPPLTKTCVALHAQHKSAGNTLKRTLDAHAPAFLGAVGASARCDDANFDWASKRCPDLDPAAGANRWLNGGYALSHAAAGPSCAWITNFREPVARLVSAQFHCTLHDHDPLCGDRPAAWFAAANASRMARYWGNFGFTNLLLAPRFAGTAAPRRDMRARRRDGAPKVWQRWRAALGGGDDPRTEAGAANLRRVVAALGDLFDVVVVVERWEDSMALLDCRVPLRDGTWADLAGAHLNTHGSEQHGDRAAAALAVARADPAVAEEIAADTAIYSAALALFERMRASTEACAS
ncbi:hypothetical protein SO694_00112069 [Aureococcus anophagefferens]|uniref:Uncharacterized protein n=1 Tax=Aureococcus anophagefferens TaxID=44056 RepID=A0ABR1FWT0_AURAN